MAHGVPLNKLETKDSSKRLLVASDKGSTRFDGISPNEITNVTWLVRDEDVFGSGPANYDIPVLANAKDVDVVITKTKRVFKFIENTGKYELWSDNIFILISEKGSTNGVAELDGGGKVPSSQLPGFVDDVLSYIDLASFPVTGTDGILYIAEDTNLIYRWTGSAYVEISPSLALGETMNTAYRGDRGKIAYDHSQSTGSNPHQTTLQEAFVVSPALVFVNDPDYIFAVEAGVLKKINAAGLNVFNQTTELTKTGITDQSVLALQSGSTILQPEDMLAGNSYEGYLFGILSSVGANDYDIKLYIAGQSVSTTVTVASAMTNELFKAKFTLDFIGGIDASRTAMFSGFIQNKVVLNTILTIDASTSKGVGITFQGTDASNEITIYKAMLNRIIA